MNNFDDFEKKNYKGVEVKYNFITYVGYSLSMIKFAFNIAVFMIKEIFEILLTSPPKKDLTNQLALVTGE